MNLRSELLLGIKKAKVIISELEKLGPVTDIAISKMQSDIIIAENNVLSGDQIGMEQSLQTIKYLIKLDNQHKQRTMKFKTALEHFEDFPEPWRTQAIELSKTFTDNRMGYRSIKASQALESAFEWDETPQGHKHWLKLYSKLLSDRK